MSNNSSPIFDRYIKSVLIGSATAISATLVSGLIFYHSGDRISNSLALPEVPSKEAKNFQIESPAGIFCSLFLTGFVVFLAQPLLLRKPKTSLSKGRLPVLIPTSQKPYELSPKAFGVVNPSNSIVEISQAENQLELNFQSDLNKSREIRSVVSV